MTRLAALGAAAILLVTGVVIRDVEAIAIAVLLVGGVLLLGLRGGMLGRVALGLLFVDVLFWMAPAAWSNANHGGAFSTLAVPVGLVACCAAGIAGVVKASTRLSVLGAVAVLVAGLVVLPATSDDADEIPSAAPSVLKVSSSGVEFSPSKTEVVGPNLTVVFHNKDLFWHTFTIDELDLNVRAPLGGTRVDAIRRPAGHLHLLLRHPGPRSRRDEGQAHR